jgi:hypothetical protein
MKNKEEERPRLVANIIIMWGFDTSYARHGDAMDVLMFVNRRVTVTLSDKSEVLTEDVRREVVTIRTSFFRTNQLSPNVGTTSFPEIWLQGPVTCRTGRTIL